MLTETALSRRVIGLAIEVHRQPGPGLLEPAYEACLCHDFDQAGIPDQRQAAIPIVDRDIKLDAGYRADLVIDETMIVEIKSVEALSPVHDTQILTCLRLGGCRSGRLLSFNALRLKDGMCRFVM